MLMDKNFDRIKEVILCVVLWSLPWLPRKGDCDALPCNSILEAEANEMGSN